MDVSTGEFQAVLAQIAEISAEVIQLRQQVDQVSRAEAIIRRAGSGLPDSALYPKDQPRRRGRPGHLRAVQ